MKLKHITTILLAMVGTAGFCGKNLLENSSFEQGEKSPDNWLIYLINKEQSIYGADAAHSGARGIGLNATTHKYGGGWVYEKMLNVVPGERYCLSGWIKSEAWGDNCITISWFGVKNGRPSWKSVSRTKGVNGRKDWTKVTLNVTVPKGIAFARIIAGRRWKAEGSAYFDDLRLEKISGGESSADDKQLDIPWLKAVPAVKISVGKALRSRVISSKNWQPNRPDAGILERAGSTLAIRDTALPGVGWMSPAIKIEAGKAYAFNCNIKLENAYHVALGAAFFDKSGRLLTLLAGEKLQFSANTGHRLLFCAPKDSAEVRLLVTQSRSGGKSSFSNFTLLEYGSI